MKIIEIANKPAEPVVVFPNSGQQKAQDPEPQNTYINEPKASSAPRISPIETRGSLPKSVVA